jgi:Cu-Zn family superoxide dismutase
VVPASGRIQVDVTTPRVTLDSVVATGAFDANGTALVVHAAADDQRTDPSGNSGARIACGVLVRTQ